MESGILYIVFNKWIIDPETNEMPYKIGITKNTVDERYYGLGLKMPGDFETLFAYRIKDYAKAEQSIHSIFNKNCVNGEWFKLNKNDIELIEEICKKMDGKLVTEEIKNEIEYETGKKEENLLDNSIMTLEDLIRTIGMKTFVEYFDKLKNDDLQDIIHYMKLHENYSINSVRTKTSTGKRIFREKLEKEALEIISKSERVDEKTRKEALKILEKANGV